MYIVSAIDKYTSKATRILADVNIEKAKSSALRLRKVYMHVTVHNEETGKIVMQRKEATCCKVSKVEFN